MKRILSIAMCIASIFLAVGCSSKYKNLETFSDSALSSVDLSSGMVVVNNTTPGYCVYNGHPYPKSGIYLSNSILQIAKSYSQNVVLSSNITKSPADFLSYLTAKKVDANYLIFATIDNWEDHATEWNGIPDRITIRMELYRISDGLLLANDYFMASSKWATFGGDHPQDLLEVPLNKIISKWFKSEQKKIQVNLEDPVLRSSMD
jgi:hypothetical protein